jgi:predicted transglutaminase-like protease
MDYTIKKTLKLEMEFEQKRVKEWFDQNRDKFQDILINIGFTSVLYHTTSQKKSRESVFQSDISSGGDVDLKI